VPAAQRHASVAGSSATTSSAFLLFLILYGHRRPSITLWFVCLFMSVKACRAFGDVELFLRTPRGQGVVVFIIDKYGGQMPPGALHHKGISSLTLLD
jgi:hypothetical protein